MPVKAMPPEQPSNHPVDLTATSQPTLSKSTKQLDRTSQSSGSTATNQPTLSKPTKQLGKTSQLACSSATNQPANSKSSKKRQNKKLQNLKDSNCFLDSKIKQNISNSCNEVCFLIKDCPTILVS